MVNNQDIEICALYSYKKQQKEAIESIAERVRKLREGGKLSPEVMSHIRKYFRIKNIYHSNAIEGNILSVGETQQVVELGLTITGKPLKDQAEAKNLSDALGFLEELAGNPETAIKEVDIRQLHYLVLKNVNNENAGKYRTVPVEISGSQYKPPPPEQVSSQMQDFGQWLAQNSVASKIGSIDGLLFAATAHTWLVYIHPFVDGNGRVARLLMNLILMRYGYPIAIITKEDRLRYYDALELSQTSDLSGFIALLTECVHESLEEYEEAAKEDRERKEWADSLTKRLSEKDRIHAKSEYEVWKNAMELLKSYFRQTAELLDEKPHPISIFFKDFGTLEFEKFMSLRMRESAKRTWFFRVDFLDARDAEKTVRYLFFFGIKSWNLQNMAGVTLRLAREEPPGSFHYDWLKHISAPNVPSVAEIGYRPDEEKFVACDKNERCVSSKVEKIGKKFFEEVLSKHFDA